MAGSDDFYLGFRFLKSLYIIFPLIYKRIEWSALLTLLLFLTAASNEYIAFHSGTIVGKFYNTLLTHDESAFWNVFYKASLIYLLQTFVYAIVWLTQWMLSIAMRRNLVTSLHDAYFQRNVYFKVNNINSNGIDNPDQRITQDAEKLTTLLSGIFAYLLISPGVIGFYTYKTWKTAGAVGVGCIYGYFLIGTIVNRLLVSPITKYTARVEKAEGDFRYKHVSVRDHSEESAFYSGHAFEHESTNNYLFSLLRNNTILAMWKFPAKYFQLFFDYYGGVITYAIQIIPIFMLNSYKGYTPGELAEQISNVLLPTWYTEQPYCYCSVHGLPHFQNAFFFMYLINSFTRLTDLAMSVGEMAGYSQRIAALVEYSRKPNEKSSEESILIEDNLLFKLDNVSYTTDTTSDRILASNISIELPSKSSILITGYSGIGKTSLLRILKNLWQPKKGSIERHISDADIMYLPQRPYLPVGKLSLVDQLYYPHRVDSFTKVFDYDAVSSEVIKTLEELTLSTLLQLCGSIDQPVDFEWQDTLSPGEQQRLSIARVLLQKPKVVVMDESTSSVGLDMEKRIYNLLAKAGINYISTGHRTSLLEFHDMELRITDGCWSLHSIKALDLMS